DQSPRRCVDHYRVRFSKSQQPTGCCGRLTDYPCLLRLIPIGRIVDDYKPGRDSYTNTQSPTDSHRQLFDSGTYPKACLDRLLGIIFVGHRMTEMSNHDVADMPADRPITTARNVSDTSTICPDHIGQILNVEGRGRRANKLAERNCELAPLRL